MIFAEFPAATAATENDATVLLDVRCDGEWFRIAMTRDQVIERMTAVIDDVHVHG